MKAFWRNAVSLFLAFLLMTLAACSKSEPAGASLPSGESASTAAAAATLPLSPGSSETAAVLPTAAPTEAVPETEAPTEAVPESEAPTEAVPETEASFAPEILGELPLELRILVIEINPVLRSIQNPSLYPEHDGHPTVGEFFQQNADRALEEMVRDLEDASHGTLRISVDRIWLDEFPTYKTLVNRTDGSVAHSFDEATYLDRIGYQGGSFGDWFRLWDEGVLDDVGSYSFDYTDLLDRFDLAERRNQGEFDQVWLLTIDPASTYETILVGRNAYWINGDPIIRNCDDFLLLNVSISRRDANLHALGHGMEGILNHVFPVNPGSDYWEGSYHVPDLESYLALNDWQKFLLGSRNNADSELSGVGDVHFPFNGAYDYDYGNTAKVPTNWREWESYPELSGQFLPDNCNAWLDHEINLRLSEEDDKDPDRLYMRFWFSLMPHIEGRNADGYARSWWRYLCSADQVRRLYDPSAKKITVRAGDAVAVNCTVWWLSGKTNRLSRLPAGENVRIENPEVLEFRNGCVYARAPGSSELLYCLDGQSVSYHITVTDPDAD